MAGDGEQAGPQLGGDGIPAQCQLQALGHWTPASGKHLLGGGERVANGV
jgi:hypothetical protein